MVQPAKVFKNIHWMLWICQTNLSTIINAKAAIPKLITAIKGKITKCEDSFVESWAKELIQKLKANQSNFETQWQFEAQLSELTAG